MRLFQYALMFSIACLLGQACSNSGGEVEPDVEIEEILAEAWARPIPEVDVSGVVSYGFEVLSDDQAVMARMSSPQSCLPNSPCGVIVLVAETGEAGLTRFEDYPSEALAALTGKIVVRYNPVGTGIGANLSEGEIDYGGRTDQDVLKDIITAMDMKAQVDGEDIGLVSFGSGLIPASGAIARFQDTNLNCRYLVDVEGETNRCFSTQAPFTIDPDGDHINMDGASDVTFSRCDFDLTSRMDKFPAGTSSGGKGEDGTPNSYICNEFAFPLKQTGRTCGDDPWWAEREAKNYLPLMEVHYQRLQFKHDHKQPTRYASREALYWVTKESKYLSYRLNMAPLNKAMTLLSETQLEDSGVYLDIHGIGNGLGSGIFDKVGDFSRVSVEEFFVVILPDYIKGIPND